MSDEHASQSQFESGSDGAPAPKGMPRYGLSRRAFLGTSTAVGAGLAAASVWPARPSEAATLEVPPAVARGATEVTLRVNGEERTTRVDARTTLLDLLRERLGLTGTKKGCNQGACGACTVHVDTGDGPRRVNSCLMLAMQVEGAEVTTIEGLASDGEALHPLQDAFIEHDGFQCGYCTSGQIMSGLACIEEGHATSEAEVQEWMSGNLCRCGAYPGIRAAILQVADAPPAANSE